MFPFDKSSYLDKYIMIRRQTIDICKPLAVEDFVAQPVVDVSPPKWHMGHTTWFFEALVLDNYSSNYKEFDHRYGFLFNSYYNTVGDRVQRPDRGHEPRRSRRTTDFGFLLRGTDGACRGSFERTPARPSPRWAEPLCV